MSYAEDFSAKIDNFPLKFLVGHRVRLDTVLTSSSFGMGPPAIAKICYKKEESDIVRLQLASKKLENLVDADNLIFGDMCISMPLPSVTKIIGSTRSLEKLLEVDDIVTISSRLTGDSGIDSSILTINPGVELMVYENKDSVSLYFSVDARPEAPSALERYQLSATGSANFPKDLRVSGSVYTAAHLLK